MVSYFDCKTKMRHDIYMSLSTLLSDIPMYFKDLLPIMLTHFIFSSFQSGEHGPTETAGSLHMIRRANAQVTTVIFGCIVEFLINTKNEISRRKTCDVSFAYNSTN